MTQTNSFELSCPTPFHNNQTVQLAHGGGGRLMHRLIDEVFLSAFGGDPAGAPHDSTVVDLGGQRVALTTDSYVVQPLFFPGGDIGCMAVYGTVNDLAMAGATPRFLSTGFIIEEGFPMETLARVTASMKAAAERSGVRIVTGDTKVVDKGKGDGLFINTAGIGSITHSREIHPSKVVPGDAILISGDIGRHGTAIMAQREGLEFESTIESDCAPLHRVVQALIDEDISVHCLRDLTRGGLATALVEIAQAANVEILVERNAVPVREEVHGACEILGLDPLYVANEGCCLACVPEEEAARALDIMRGISESEHAARVGSVPKPLSPGRVHLRSEIGALRVLDMLSGEQLPRIC